MLCHGQVEAHDSWLTFFKPIGFIWMRWLKLELQLFCFSYRLWPFTIYMVYILMTQIDGDSHQTRVGLVKPPSCRRGAQHLAGVHVHFCFSSHSLKTSCIKLWKEHCSSLISQILAEESFESQLTPGQFYIYHWRNGYTHSCFNVCMVRMAIEMVYLCKLLTLTQKEELLEGSLAFHTSCQYWSAPSLVAQIHSPPVQTRVRPEFVWQFLWDLPGTHVLSSPALVSNSPHKPGWRMSQLLTTIHPLFKFTQSWISCWLSVLVSVFLCVCVFLCLCLLLFACVPLSVEARGWVEILGTVNDAAWCRIIDRIDAV